MNFNRFELNLKWFKQFHRKNIKYHCSHGPNPAGPNWNRGGELQGTRAVAVAPATRGCGGGA
jgi:hypothetical protein